MPSVFNDPAFWLLFLFLVPLMFGLPIAMAMGTSAAFVIWWWDLGWQSISYSFFSNVAKSLCWLFPFHFGWGHYGKVRHRQTTG